MNLIDFPFAAFQKKLDQNTRSKGLRIVREFEGEITFKTGKKDTIDYTVPSESGDNSYKVQFLLKKDSPEASCTCPAYRHGYCKHIAAAVSSALATIKIPDKQARSTLDQRAKEKNAAPNVQLPKIPVPIASSVGSIIIESDRNDILTKLCNPNTTRPKGYKEVQFQFSDKLPRGFKGGLGGNFASSIMYLGNNQFELACNCKMKQPCTHIKSLALNIGWDIGASIFAIFLSEEEKQKYLDGFGLKVSDPESVKFYTTLDGTGRVQLVPPDHYLSESGIGELTGTLQKSVVNTMDEDYGLNPIVVIRTSKGKIAEQLGFEIGLVKSQINVKKGTSTSKVVDLNSIAADDLMEYTTSQFRQSITDFKLEAIRNWLKSKKFYNPYYSFGKYDLQIEKIHYPALIQRMHYLMKGLWPEIVKTGLIVVESSDEADKLQLKEYLPQRAKIKAVGNIEELSHFYKLTVKWFVQNNEEEEIELSGAIFFKPFFIVLHNHMFLLENPKMLDLLNKMTDSSLVISKNYKQDFVLKLLPELTRLMDIEVPDSLQVVTRDIEFIPHVMVSELDENYILIASEFKYGEAIVTLDDKNSSISFIDDDGSTVLVNRNKAGEKAFHDSLIPYHPNFIKQGTRTSYYLSFADAKKKNWFAGFINQMSERNITVLGIDKLKHLRYSPFKPEMKIQASSSIDWFDLKMEVWFGEERISLDRVRKVLQQNQHIIILNDGSMGILPEEWISKYEMLFKLSTGSDKEKLQISKHHFSSLDSIMDNLDSEDIKEEIRSRKDQIYNAQNIITKKVSSKIKADLRPYQVLGYQWMQLLDEMKFGGCLADDMGLGKTLQTISFIQFIKEKYKGQTSLVICPVSLIFNWQNELEKFAPTIKYKIHYGLDRNFTKDDFAKYDLVLTSYSLVRNDVEEFSKYFWQYIILDESQAIKNPESQTAKSLMLLKSHNRIALSGTPVQNNTFDLYSQFNFLNPGLLGNKAFFKEEFANAIDKKQNEEKTLQLRKIVYPFMLRRTKEQVAPDLPEKMESIIWCEMEADQRKVYNEYKKFYRDSLLDRIESEGIERAGIYILEGLLRLRQICDSPKLLKKKEFNKISSTKLDELLREIEDNIGNHKMLVFSQFTEMLGLIEDEFKKKKIRYAYLDGSTKQTDRQKAVEEFQQEEDCRIFLISLKAGGVGLNLTAADYVFLIDPWWNPAAEQQAIDRTHRIGQTKKIIAYKMICKDSVEEKILALQNNKKKMAGELIGEDQAVMKKLKKEDIEYLFS